MHKKRVLSCIQPTGEIHIGNYFGAVRNWVTIQDQYSCVYGVVDLHAMTMPYSSKELRQNTLNMFADLIAAGLDPEKSILFIQSMVPQHTELTWIFSCVTSFGELSRMTQFKDKSDLLESGGKNAFISAGLFTYPVLQAADILIYKADFVPVGKDQEQHLELSRNIAVRFNNQFGDYFPEPKPLYTEVPKLMSLADPEKKMSKSLGDKHYIGLFEKEESIRKKVKSAVTDTGGQTGEAMSPGVSNLFAIIRACEKMKEYNALMQDYEKGILKYKDLKEVTADALVDLTGPLRKRREELRRDPEQIMQLVVRSSEKARDFAEKTLNDVRGLTGLIV
ncbi:MAG: tryptophan--tRNA ligase [Bacteroidales bacterium]|nr:tryptophan--tRNA ligase [Bacteroidales bacterium]MBN2762700.1 tryptophan--tRNA ligase [Bacteroidales bacterium]